MCLFPFGNILIPPTERARKLADYMKVAVAVHLGLAIFLMVGGRYVDGVFDLLGVMIGWGAIRNSEGYSFQCVLSYCVFTGMDLFWALLRLILHFSGASSTASGLSSWQYNVFVVGLIVSPFIYLFCCVVSYKLYRELKNIIDESAGADMADESGMGGGYSAPHPSMHGSAPSGPPPSSWSHPVSHPAPSGFKAFSGQGHKLSG